MSVSSSIRRRFEFVEGTSRKFWEIEVNGSKTGIHFGRIGAAGQTSLKTFAQEGTRPSLPPR